MEVGLPGISLLVVWLTDLFIESDHRETSLFWAHTDVVGQVDSVYVYLLLTVTSHRFTGRKQTDRCSAAESEHLKLVSCLRWCWQLQIS